MFYIVLPPLELTSQHQVDFSLSQPGLSTGIGPASFQFITDKAQAPKGAAVIEWSAAIRRFIRQWD